MEFALEKNKPEAKFGIRKFLDADDYELLNDFEKNQELISQGRFFAEREDTILDARVIRYLEGKKEDSGYLQRLITKNSIYAPEDCVYMPVLVQVQKSQKKLEEIEHPLMRSIYQNILSELFESLLVSEIVLLEEEENDFFVLMYWQRKRAYTVEKILERLESFRVLFYKLLQTQIAVYCGDICEAENLAESARRRIAYQAVPLKYR